MSAQVRIEKYPHQHRVYCGYDGRLIVKAVPGSRWNPDLLCWTIPTRQLDVCVRWYASAGWEVIIIDSTATPHNTLASQSMVIWAETMMDALGCDRFEAAHRALIKLLHPDHQGGDPILCQQLNVARDRTKRKCDG